MQCKRTFEQFGIIKTVICLRICISLRAEFWIVFLRLNPTDERQLAQNTFLVVPSQSALERKKYEEMINIDSI